MNRITGAGFQRKAIIDPIYRTNFAIDRITHMSVLVGNIHAAASRGRHFAGFKFLMANNQSGAEEKRIKERLEVRREAMVKC